MYWRKTVVVLALSLIGSAPVVAGLGYLPVVGPAALRFCAVPQRATNPPPVLVSAVKPPEPKPEAPPPKPEVKETNLVSSPPPHPVPVTVTNQVSPVASAPPGSEEIVSPQMLMQYFVRSTNGTRAGVIGPLDFSPPHATDRPSSKASYSTGP